MRQKVDDRRRTNDRHSTITIAYSEHFVCLLSMNALADGIFSKTVTLTFNLDLD